MSHENKLREKPIERKNDYLKYWRSIYHYHKVKHNLTSGDIDMLLFLYSEPYFTVKKFEEFNRVLQLNRNRLNQLVDAGWIDIFRKGKARYAARYQLSRKGSSMVGSMYKQLNGGLVQETNTRLFRKKGNSYMDKRHAEQLLIRNETIRLQQRQTREE
jgi:hypothetical protein